AGTKNVCRVEALLQVAFPLNRRFRHDSRKVRATQFADPMMMREGPTGLQDFITREVLQLEVNFLRIRNAFVIKAKIEIDAYPGAIDLRDARSHERLTGKTPPRVFLSQSPLHVFAKRERVRP